MSVRSEFGKIIGASTLRAGVAKWEIGDLKIESSIRGDGATIVVITGPNEGGEPCLVYGGHDDVALVRRAKAYTERMLEAKG